MPENEPVCNTQCNVRGPVNNKFILILLHHYINFYAIYCILQLNPLPDKKKKKNTKNEI